MLIFGCALRWKVKRRQRTHSRLLEDYGTNALLFDVGPRKISDAVELFWVDFGLAKDDGTQDISSHFSPSSFSTAF